MTSSIATKPKFLFVLTSTSQMANTGGDGKPTGMWAEEMATPYYLLHDKGVTIDLASPLGGATPIDKGSIKVAGQNHADVERFLADAVLQKN